VFTRACQAYPLYALWATIPGPTIRLVQRWPPTGHHWGTGKFSQLLQLQKSAVRAIEYAYMKLYEGLSPKQHNLQHTNPLFAKYQIMKVEDIICHQQRFDGFLAITHHLPSSINSFLISPSEVHQHSTRAAGFSLRSKHHYKSSIIAATAASFNDFAKQVDRMDLSKSAFRKKSKEQILESYENFKCTDRGCCICSELRDLHIAMPHLRGRV
jgi:hypothetical protein